MAFTVADVILAARDVNPAFTPTRHPDAVCRRFVARYVKALSGKIAEKRPRALTATVTTVLMSAYNFTTGYAIPAHLLLTEVTLHATIDAANDRIPVDLVPMSSRHGRTQRKPFGWIDGTTFFLAGAATDYSGFDTLYLRTAAMPTAAAAADAVPFPDDGLDACAGQLAAFLAQRHANGPDTAKFDASPYEVRGRESEKTFLDRITNQGRAEVWRIRLVR